jgi:hypothetical protein
MAMNLYRKNKKQIKALVELYLSDEVVAKPFVESCKEELSREWAEQGSTQEQVDERWEYYLSTKGDKDAWIVALYFESKPYAWVNELYQRNRKDIKAMEVA